MRRTLPIVVLWLLASASAPGVATAQSAGGINSPSIQLPGELDRVLRDYERAWRARDPDALAQLFTDDGFVLSNRKPPVRGRSAIREAYAKSGGPLALRAFAYAVDGEVGYIVGGYGGSEDAPDDGKFVLALRKGKGGRWLIAADMDNSNKPPPSPQ